MLVGGYSERISCDQPFSAVPVQKPHELFQYRVFRPPLSPPILDPPVARHPITQQWCNESCQSISSATCVRAIATSTLHLLRATDLAPIPCWAPAPRWDLVDKTSISVLALPPISLVDSYLCNVHVNTPWEKSCMVNCSWWSFPVSRLCPGELLPGSKLASRESTQRMNSLGITTRRLPLLVLQPLQDTKTAQQRPPCSRHCANGVPTLSPTTSSVRDQCAQSFCWCFWACGALLDAVLFQATGLSVVASILTTCGEMGCVYSAVCKLSAI